MPYASNKQAAYMHIHHPDIAAKWHEAGHGYVKGGKNDPAKKKRKVRKNAQMQGWLKPLSVGVIGGALANQFPSYEERERRRALKARRKGQIKKMQAPASDDPHYNQEAAQKAFDLVMKMDDDTAEVFCHVVTSDYFEETVEKNLGTLQRHLNETLQAQLADLKKAHVRLVAKGMDSQEAVAYAQAIALIEKQLADPISKAQGKKNPYQYGYVWREQDFNRDPGSGQFRTKISHNQTKELDDKVFTQLTGASTPSRSRSGKKLTEEDRVRFQDEYRQLSGFMQAVRASTGPGGNTSVMLHYRDRNGNDFSQVHFGTKPPIDDLADPDFRLLGVEAKPTTLTAGGAAFGLATALGGGMNSQQIEAINNVEGGAGRSFSEKWLSSGDAQNSNAKLYGRLAASGDLISSVGGPKAQMAGKFASIVGSAGPQAEAVLGPTTRKTAYRYRGTEKSPERNLVRAYDQGIKQGKVWGDLSEAEQEEAVRGYATRPRGKAPRAKEGGAPQVHRMAENRMALEQRAPEWGEREPGRRAIVDHLRAKLPKKNLYELQLASGNTPPSEGVILNADGQIVTQAVGYGDDHYLPFNLKNLKGLKGGEYIRTRSVGGLTSEDIYTAMMMGARRVTVTSRSGTYVMEFEPDFRGGRRHNDKARRMTRRYEQLLDAVQSQQVERIDIDPEMRQQIENEVKEEMSGAGWTQRDRMEAIRERIDEFKENPYITEQDEKRAEAIITSRGANASEAEKARIRASVYDDLMDQKETKFRLNSAGYKAALDALQEQFPYYIKQPRWTPPRDEGKKIETALDRGYVEPGRNRPTAAKAGLYGTKANPGQKFSASHADYQGTRHAPGRAVPVETEEAAAVSAGGDRKSTEKERRKALAGAQNEYKVSEVATKIQENAKGKLGPKSQADPDIKRYLDMTGDELKDADNLEGFNNWVGRYLGMAEVNEPGLRREWEAAYGGLNREKFDRKNIQSYPKFPPKFDEDAYEAGASRSEVDKELNRIDRKARSGVVNAVPLSGMTEQEYASEHRALAGMHRALQINPEQPLSNAVLQDLGVDTTAPAVAKLRRDPDAIVEQMEYLQRARALTSGMSSETREARQSAATQREVVRAQPQTKTARAAVTGNVQANINLARSIADQLETLEDKDEDEIETIRNLASDWEEGAGELTNPEQTQAFNAVHDDALRTLMRAMHRLNNPSS